MFEWDYEPSKSCKRLLFLWADIVRLRFLRGLPDGFDELPLDLADGGIGPEDMALRDQLLSKFLDPRRRPVHQLIVWCYRWILGYTPKEIAQKFSGDTLVEMLQRLRSELPKAYGNPPGWMCALEEALARPSASKKPAGAESLGSLFRGPDPARELTLWISNAMVDFRKEIGGRNA
jgi:hypothetical protein